MGSGRLLSTITGVASNSALPQGDELRLHRDAGRRVELAQRLVEDQYVLAARSRPA
jgi:hypothetical protein